MDHIDIGHRLSPVFGENILNSVLENAKVGDLLALYGSYGTWLHIWMYGIISLHVRKRYCLSAFYLNFCLCGFRFATTVGRMLLPLSAFIICFARMPFSWYLPTGSCVGDSALWSDASGSGIAFQRLLVDYDIRSLYAADRRSVCRSYRHWSSHADTFILLFMGTAQADQRAFLHGIFSHAAGFQKQIVHGHLSFIIDEQDAAGVYYLPLLTDISGWISPKRKQANGKCSLSQMAEPLKYQSMRPKQPRKCSLMRQTVSMPRK